MKMVAFSVFRGKDFESIRTPEGEITPIFVNEHISISKLNLPPKLSVPPHSHGFNVVAVVAKGRLEILHESRKTVLEEGDVFFAPAGTKIGISNPSQEVAEILCISYPPTCKSVEELKKILKSFSGVKE